MHRTMRELMAVGFRDRNPGWTDAEERRAVADASFMPPPDELSLFVNRLEATGAPYMVTAR